MDEVGSYTLGFLVAKKKQNMLKSWDVKVKIKAAISFNSYQIRSDKMKSCHYIIPKFPRGTCAIQTNSFSLLVGWM